MIKISVITKGMSCSSCEMLLKQALEEVDGVAKASPDRKNGVVEVEFDSTAINPGIIKKIIEREGYTVVEQ